jgi:hypothetical protein
MGGAASYKLLDPKQNEDILEKKFIPHEVYTKLLK